MDITPEQFEQLVRSNAECSHGINELKTATQLIVRYLNGDPGEDVITGIRPRLRNVELAIQQINGKLDTAERRLENWQGAHSDLTMIKEKVQTAERRLKDVRSIAIFLGLANLPGWYALWQLVTR